MELAEAKNVNGVVRKLSPARDSDSGEGKPQGICAGGAADGGGGAEVGGDFALKGGDLFAQHQRLRLADLVNGGAHLLTNGGILALQVKHGNGRGLCGG